MQNKFADLWFHKPSFPSLRLLSVTFKVLKLVGGKQRNSPIFRILCSIMIVIPESLTNICWFNLGFIVDCRNGSSVKEIRTTGEAIDHFGLQFFTTNTQE